MPSPPRQLRLEQLVDGHAARRQSLIETLIRAILGIWSGFDRWYDDDLLNSAAARAAMLALAAAREARRLDRAFNKAVFDEFGLRYDDLGEVEDIYPRSGVSPLDVYRRPGLQYRYAIKQGKSEVEAREIALERAESLATTDVRIAGRDESVRDYSKVKAVLGWRRILHPELSRSGPCGLCVVAADRVYRSGDLEDIHDGCVCGKLPITDADDPGLRMNRNDLDRLYAAAGGNAGDLLKRIRVQVRENGEIGPVLVRAGDNFRDAEDAGATRYSPPTLDEHRANLLRMKESLVGTTDRLQSRLADPTTPADDVLAIQTAIRRNHETLTALDRRLLSR